MGRTPDAYDGPRIDEAVIWEEQGSDPAETRKVQYVTGKGLVILEDGVVRGIGEGRENIWQPPVDARNVNAPPSSPATGYRVIVGSSPTGDFVGHPGEIAQWTGSSWVFTVPKQGTTAVVKAENAAYQQTAASVPWTWASGSGGGLNPTTHRDLDQLVHMIAEAAYYEVSYSGSRVNVETWWTDAAKTTKIREVTYGYTGSRVSSETWRQYDASGVQVATFTITYTYTGPRVTSANLTYSEP